MRVLDERFPSDVVAEDERAFRRMLREERIAPATLRWAREFARFQRVGSAVPEESWESAFRSWLADVLSIRVDFGPGRRAVLVAPKTHWAVEIRWKAEELHRMTNPGTDEEEREERAEFVAWVEGGKLGQNPILKRAPVIREGGQPVVERRITSYRVAAPPGKILPWEPIPMAPYLAAFYLRASAVETPAERDVPPPRSGRPIEHRYYAALLEEFQGLQREGHPAPAQEIAARRGLVESTVRAQLARGRRYLGRTQ